MKTCFKIIFCLFTFINFSYSYEIIEHRYTAAEHALIGNIYDSNNQSSMEYSFIHLWKAHLHPDFRESAGRDLQELDKKYDEWLEKHCVPFLDTPEPDKEEFYAIRARFKDPRGLRLYGELLLEQGKIKDGWSYLETAAAKNDPRALFLVAERHARGLGEVKQDFKKAVILMQRSAEMQYAPACEMLAKIYWDAYWAKCNPKLAITYLKKAIHLYKKWTLCDENEQLLFSTMTSILDCVLDMMNSILRDNPFANTNIWPSYDAILTSFYNENSDIGLRARMYYILNDMQTWGGNYAIQALAEIDLGMVEINKNELKNVSGMCYYWQWDQTYSFKIEIDAGCYPNPPKEDDNSEQWLSCPPKFDTFGPF